MQLPAWWSWWYLWSFFKFAAPIIVSVIALWFVLKDRRPNLLLKARKGNWFSLYETLPPGGVVFQGIVEIYNLSARANAIHSYGFFCRQAGEPWREMESERYDTDPTSSGESVIHNQTPLALEPYSGLEVKVEAMLETYRRPREMQVRIEAEDIFGKRNHVIVTAISR